MSEPEAHKGLATQAVKLICAPLANGEATPIETLIVTESVVVGVVLMLTRMGGDDKVLDVMIRGVRNRLAEIRLTHMQTVGEG